MRKLQSKHEKVYIRSKGAGVKQPVHFAARYGRIGATHFFAALSVAEGLIYGCYRPTKTFLLKCPRMETVESKQTDLAKDN